MKKKGIAVVLLAALILTLLCGCSTELSMTLNADGTGSMTQTVLIEKEYTEGDGVTLDKTFTYEDVTVDGKAYKKGTKSVTFSSVNAIPDMDGYQLAFDENSFYMRNAEGSDVSGEAATGMTSEEFKEIYQYNCTITFPYEVKKTNGTIQPDQKTVVWDCDQMYENANCWAVFTDVPTDASIPAPKITGAKNNGYYKKNITVKVDSDTVIDTFSVNGNAVGAGSCLITQEGKQKVTCTDINGRTTTISFVMDQTKPTVKGVANGKTYMGAKTIKFSDKYGIKSATLNGKKISSGKVVSKKGSYKLVVTDKAGNKSIIKFKITSK